MPSEDRLLEEMRAICLALPDAKETMTWGKPHFRVGDKIFAGYGEEGGRAVIGFKLEMDHARAILADPRFWKAPYVGHKGWVSMDANQVSDWAEVKELVLESYRLIAPKRTLARLGGAPAMERSLRPAAKTSSVRLASRTEQEGKARTKATAKAKTKAKTKNKVKRRSRS